MPRRTWFTRRRAITFSLAVATAGEAIPYGTASGPTSHAVVPLETGLSIAAGVAVIALVVDLVSWSAFASTYRRLSIAYALTGATWLTLASYDALLDGATVTWRVAHVLVDVGIALLALHTWRFTARGGDTRGV